MLIDRIEKTWADASEEQKDAVESASMCLLGNFRYYSKDAGQFWREDVELVASVILVIWRMDVTGENL